MTKVIGTSRRFSLTAVKKASGMFVLLLSDQMTNDQGEDKHTETKKGESEDVRDGLKCI